jgi:hypothetical protein
LFGVCARAQDGRRFHHGALRPFADPGHVSPADDPDKHLTASAIRARYFSADSWSSYFFFAFIRNPWDWIHSDYWCCISRAAQIFAHAAAWVQKLRRLVADRFAYEVERFGMCSNPTARSDAN